MRRHVIHLFGGMALCATTAARSSGGGSNGNSIPHPNRPSRGRSKPSRLNNAGLSRGGGASSSLPDELLDLFEDDGGGVTGSSSNSYDVSFLDDLDESDGQESLMGDLSDDEMGGDYSGDDDDDHEEEDYGQGSEKGALYDAYNLLHSLAQVGCIGLFRFANRLLFDGLIAGVHSKHTLISLPLSTGFSKAI